MRFVFPIILRTASHYTAETVFRTLLAFLNMVENTVNATIIPERTSERLFPKPYSQGRSVVFV